MKSLTFSNNNALVSEASIRNSVKKLLKEIKILSNLNSDYSDSRSSINLPLDLPMLRGVKDMIKEKLKLKPSYLIVVGIGGSNLGTIAIQEAVLGKLYNQLNPKIKVLYADTVDSDSINSIIQLIKSEKGNVLLNVISKSGTTAETVANFEVLLNTLKKYKKNFNKYVVAATDQGSRLWDLAIKNHFDVLEIPKKVGGRYSVFSPVGLFPLGMLGINLEKLLRGAEDMKHKCLSKSLNTNPAAISAALAYLNYKKGNNIQDLFLFSNDLESLGRWNRQLIGESLGKNKKGITPTVSIGSTDLHSVAQLYLGGPYDKFTTFVSIDKNHHPNNKLDRIMKAILAGTQKSFRKNKRPFTKITLPDKSEYSIGQFLQLKMIETIYLGSLMNVNPFDQPKVEDYKAETRKLLK